MKSGTSRLVCPESVGRVNDEEAEYVNLRVPNSAYDWHGSCAFFIDSIDWDHVECARGSYTAKSFSNVEHDAFVWDLADGVTVRRSRLFLPDDLVEDEEDRTQLMFLPEEESTLQFHVDGLARITVEVYGYQHGNDRLRLGHARIIAQDERVQVKLPANALVTVHFSGIDNAAIADLRVISGISVELLVFIILFVVFVVIAVGCGGRRHRAARRRRRARAGPARRAGVASATVHVGVRTPLTNRPRRTYSPPRRSYRPGRSGTKPGRFSKPKRWQ